MSGKTRSSGFSTALRPRKNASSSPPPPRPTSTRTIRREAKRSRVHGGVDGVGIFVTCARNGVHECGRRTSGRTPMSETPGWPAAVSIAKACEMLTAPGAPYEMGTIVIRGRPTRFYKNAPPHLRAVFDTSRQWGERDFIVFEKERLTFEGHWRAASALARVFTDKYGVKKGDRVVIAMRNLPEWSIAFWAGAAIGAVMTPLNGWGTGEALAYGVSDSAARVLVADAERLARIEPHLHQLGLTGLLAVRTPRDQLGSADAIEDLIGPPAAYLNLSDQPLPDPGLEPEDDATILYTSGTTGRPKGAHGSQRNIMSNLISIGFSGARAIVRRTGELPPPVEPDPP